jgi:monoterpene epsilon-lactone hydrolase
MSSQQMLKAIEGFRRRRERMGDQGSIVDQREAYEAVARAHPAPADIEVETVSMNGVPADLLSGAWIQQGGAILYLHGGGYTACSPRTHRELAGRIGRAAGMKTYVPDYRLAPEHPFPAAVDDAHAAYRFMLEDASLEPRRIAVAGDSAGGGLAMALLLSLLDAKHPLPGCVCLMSPWTDLTLSGASAHSNADIDPVCTLAESQTFAEFYIGSSNPRDPLISPLFGFFNGMPPTLIQVGSEEILLDDSTRLADRLRAAGVDVSLEMEAGAVHVWQTLPQVPEAIEATDRIASFIRANSVEPDVVR